MNSLQKRCPSGQGDRRTDGPHRGEHRPEPWDATEGNRKPLAASPGRALSSTSAHSEQVKQREQGRAAADGGRAGRVYQTPPDTLGLQKPIPATANAAPR